MLGKLMKNIVSRFSKRQEGSKVEEEIVIKSDVIDIDAEKASDSQFTTLPFQVMTNQGMTLAKSYGDAFRALLETINQRELKEAGRRKIEELSGMPYAEYCESQVVKNYFQMGNFIREYEQKQERKKKNRFKKFRLRAYAKAKRIDYKAVRDCTTTKEELVAILKEY